ncbi:MAG TPA: DegT/DnrJ/EryC1/StrS family aminotransferase [Candidatus Avamphibacillus sp.]|nr:DegT/DnrJ/EryC1/StrS family aminotransferase [Candidatus Avamphibacillus sp.]
MIPISNPKSQFTLIQDDILKEMKTILQSGQYILGENVDALEQEIANRLGVTEAIGVGNGTDALVLTLDAYGIGKGDEVITTPYSFFATAEAITRVGATPIFADVDRETFNLDPNKVEEKVTAKTKAILPVHLFGQPAEMDKINAIAAEHALVVIEDACQAFGATYKGRQIGALGDAACFSFFPTKNLSTMGDGGVITTSDTDLAKRLRTLRAHGSYKKYYHHEIGYNSRLDEIHATIILIGLKHLDDWNGQRRELAKRYKKNLQDISNLKIPQIMEDVTHVFHLYCIESEKRDELAEQLSNESIQTGIYYPRCIHLQKAYKTLGYQTGDFPIAESLSRRLLAIPLYPGLSFKNQDKVIFALKKAVKE